MAASATLSFIAEQFDARVADKPAREKFYHDVVEFSYRQPFIASFVFLQLMFALLPLLGFLGFSLGVVIITLGICGFWIGVGLCVLFSTLAFTATIATGVWLCACGSFVCARWSMQILSGAPPAETRRHAIGNTDRRKEKDDRVPRDRPATAKRLERKLQDNIPPYRDVVAAKAADRTDDESGSDTGNRDGDRDGEKTLTPPDGATYRVQDVSESEKMRRDIERSLK